MKKLGMNGYFHSMENVAVRAEAQKELIKEQRHSVIEQFGWKAPQLEMLKQMESSIIDPCTKGQWKAFHAWRSTLREDEDAETLVMDDFLWEEEIAGFVLALREAGCDKFYFTNRSTAVMENIHGFIAAGCKMVGTVSWEEKDRFHTEQVLGLEFEL